MESDMGPNEIPSGSSSNLIIARLQENDNRYRIHRSRDWVPGVVFKVHWSQPWDSSLHPAEHKMYMSNFQKVEIVADNGLPGYMCTGTRTFMVVSTDYGCSTCVAITTEGSKLRRGASEMLDPAKHGIIDDKKHPRRGASFILGFDPVRMIVSQEGESLRPGSLVCYAKMVTVEHNCAIFIIGHLENKHLSKMQDAVNKCWATRQHRFLPGEDSNEQDQRPAKSGKSTWKEAKLARRRLDNQKHNEEDADEFLAEPFTDLNVDNRDEDDTPISEFPVTEPISTDVEAPDPRFPIQPQQDIGHTSWPPWNWNTAWHAPFVTSDNRLVLHANARPQEAQESMSAPNDQTLGWPYTQPSSYRDTRPASREDFQIAFLCALPVEKTAVQAMFDVDYDWERAPRYGTAQHDDNVYAHGRIGQYNVVVTNIGGKGKRLAAGAAKDVRYTWPGLQLILVVGICGAVPFPSSEIGEIILGDVVIGSGVVQYDHGRHTDGGFIPYKQPEDLLPAPRSRVQHRVDKFRGVIDNRRLCDKLVRNLQHIQRVPGIKAAYPGAEHDKLFRGDVIHATAGVPCNVAGCNVLIHRRRLANFRGSRPRPAVHIGPIGSADILMKSGSERDRIAEQDGVIAFEMEGAGAMGDMPCLVIKGVSDYADSHKNKRWQPHAAAAAAACAAAFLDDW
ncbi:nucleoside phosphorylase domain-containing protein [Plectosphaerella cucumerina]|uniref:Nucleoside phosphorylase domain-containing protein n=1 Tax=Plectosphaerella cucumerina TaxID=40658 RepID=A0A8K0TFB7_9PEZI|nr:nucleoside phosphorylase domain-containing protein [Plectosphaerella cucumerina]